MIDDVSTTRTPALRTPPAAAVPPRFSRGDVILFGSTLAVTAVAGIARYAGAGTVFPFVAAAAATALLASVVGRSVDRLGDRLGAGATGVLQSALGNLP